MMIGYRPGPIDLPTAGDIGAPVREIELEPITSPTPAPAEPSPAPAPAPAPEPVKEPEHV